MNEVFSLPVMSSIAVFFATALGIGPVVGIWDSVAAKYVSDFAPILTSFGLKQASLRVYLRYWGIVLLLVAFLLGFSLQMPLLAAAILAVVFFAPRLWLKFKIERSKDELRNQIVGACMRIANSSRAGMSLPQAIKSTAEETPDPLGGILNRICYDYRSNMPLYEAISRASERIGLETFSLFSVTINTCYQQGGNVTEMLERVSKSIAETQRLERRISSETASAQKVVWILSLFPLLFLSVMGIIHSSGTKLMFTTLLGQGLLVTSIVLIFIAVSWSRKILDVDF